MSGRLTEQEIRSIARPSSALRYLAITSITPPDVLESLGRATTVLTRELVARHPNTPLTTLHRFVTGKHPDSVVEQVAYNPNAPDYLIEHIVKDSKRSDEVRYVAVTKLQNPEVLAGLVDSDDAEILLRVANNKHTPTETLIHLYMNLQHIHPLLASVCIKNRGFPAEIIISELDNENIEPRLVKAACLSAAMTDELANKILTTFKKSAFHKLLAFNHRVSYEVLEQLVEGSKYKTVQKQAEETIERKRSIDARVKKVEEIMRLEAETQNS